MAQTKSENLDYSVQVSLKDVILKLTDWWRYLLSKWKLILFTGILGALFGLMYSFIKKPTYVAELSFALDDEKAGGGLGAAAGLASQFGIDLGAGKAGGAFNGDNLLELMRSRSMVEKALLTSVTIHKKTQTLAELYISFNNLRDSWSNKPYKDVNFHVNSDRSNFTLEQDSILGVFYHAIKRNLNIDKVDKKLSIITIKVNSKNELFSKYFAENLVKIVSDFYIQTKTEKSSQNVIILQHQTDSVRRELNTAISGVASSSDVNPNPNPSLQIIRVPSLKKEVDVQANTAILTELVKNLELSKMGLRKETPLIQIIDKPILPLEKEEFGKLKGLFLGGVSVLFLTVMVLLAGKRLKEINSDV